MGKIALHVSMSLDGFTAGPNVGVDRPMGEGGMWLHEWLFADPMHPVDAQVSKAMYDPDVVGAVLMGRRHFDVGIEHWCDRGTLIMPCFVVTHRAEPPMSKGYTRYEFVTGGIDVAVERARAAADGRDIYVIGAELTRQMMLAGLIDEMVVDVVPIVLGSGSSLFGGLKPGEVEFEQIDATSSPTVSHIRYRVMVPQPRPSDRRATRA